MKVSVGMFINTVMIIWAVVFAAMAAWGLTTMREDGASLYELSKRQQALIADYMNEVMAGAISEDQVRRQAAAEAATESVDEGSPDETLDTLMSGDQNETKEAGPVSGATVARAFADNQKALMTGDVSKAKARNLGNQWDLMVEAGAALNDQLTAETTAAFVTAGGNTREAAEALTGSLRDPSEQKDSNMTALLITIMGTALAFCVLAAWLMRRRILVPLAYTGRLVDDLIEGNFADQKNVAMESDEIGRVYAAIQQLSERLSRTMDGIREETRSLAETSSSLGSTAGDARESAIDARDRATNVMAASRELNNHSDGMTTAVQEIDNDATNIAHTIRDISGNLNRVDQSVDQITSRSSDLAAAVEEVSVTLNEITHKTYATNKMTTSAVEQARNTSQLVDRLGRSAEQVGDVVNLIKGVAEQTNLLALNATIEAASAGEAGKGFAVVANEVKELARQTDRATGEIQSQVAGIQQDTDKAVAAISEIVQLIEELRTDFDFVSNAVDEQNQVVNQICENLGANVTSSADVNQSIHQAADGVNEVNELLQRLAERTHDLTGIVLSNSESVAFISEQLELMDAGVRKSAEAVEETHGNRSRLETCANAIHSVLEQFQDPRTVA